VSDKRKQAKKERKPCFIWLLWHILYIGDIFLGSGKKKTSEKNESWRNKKRNKKKEGGSFLFSLFLPFLPFFFSSFSLSRLGVLLLTCSSSGFCCSLLGVLLLRQKKQKEETKIYFDCSFRRLSKKKDYIPPGNTKKETRKKREGNQKEVQHNQGES